MLSEYKILNFFSRILAVGLFFVSGLEKVFFYNSTAALMVSNHVTPFLLPLVIFLEVFGSLFIVFGLSDTVLPLVMCAFSILSGFLFYRGFSYPNMMVWLKNSSCGAGFLIISLNSNPLKDRFFVAFNKLMSRQ